MSEIAERLYAVYSWSRVAAHRVTGSVRLEPGARHGSCLCHSRSCSWEAWSRWVVSFYVLSAALETRQQVSIIVKSAMTGTGSRRIGVACLTCYTACLGDMPEN